MIAAPTLLLLLAQATAAPADSGLVEIAAAEHLPLAFVAEVLPRLEIGFHRMSGLAMAYYAPAVAVPPAGSGAESGDAAETAPSESDAADGATSAAAEPGAELAGPRLLLYEPYYRRSQGELVPLLEMPPDVVEYLTHALLLAYLHLEVVEDPASPYAPRLRAAARTLYPELEAERGIGIYLTALAEFGSHLLSLANEIERLERRRPDRDLCPWIEQGRFHFGAWDRAFAAGDYVGVAGAPGFAPARPAAGQASGVDESAGADAAATAPPVRPLRPGDKELLIEQVFAGRWLGTSRADFTTRYCDGARSAAPQ